MKKAEEQELMNWVKKQKEKQEAGKYILKVGVCMLSAWFIISVILANLMLISYNWVSVLDVFERAGIMSVVVLIGLVVFLTV